MNPTIQNLQAAITIRKKIDSLQLRLNKILHSENGANGVAVSLKPKRMSAKGRAAIAKAQSARWAKYRASKKKKG